MKILQFVIFQDIQRKSARRRIAFALFYNFGANVNLQMVMIILRILEEKSDYLVLLSGSGQNGMLRNLFQLLISSCKSRDIDNEKR